MCKVISLYGLDEARGSDYTCAFAWPDDCNVQAGGRGIVLSQGGKYTTAFFEAFPRDPRTFIRGEGATVLDAERQCWDIYQRILACPNHEYERRDYENGVGICKHCGMTGFNVIPGHPCRICSAPTWYTKDSDGGFYCEAHAREKPISDWTDSDWDAAYLHDRLETEEIAYRRDSQDIETHLHIDGVEAGVGSVTSTGTFYGHPYAFSSVNGIWSLTVSDKDSDIVLFQIDRDYRDARIATSVYGFLRIFFLKFRDEFVATLTCNGKEFILEHEFKDNEPLLFWYYVGEPQGRKINFDVREIAPTDDWRSAFVDMSDKERLAYVRNELQGNNGERLEALLTIR